MQTTLQEVPAPDAAIGAAVRAIPPLWPLANNVAVNPYLGQTGERLEATAARLAKVAGVRTTMPRGWYAAKIDAGAIEDADIAAALRRARADLRPDGVDAVKAAARIATPAPKALATVAELAARATGVDWPGLIADRIGAWAAGYFDEGQALWAAPRGRSAYAAWRATAIHDLTPEIAGLRGFAAHAADAPVEAREAIRRATERLGVPAAARETYFHALLATLGGWAQYARYKLWQAELAGGTDQTLVDLLAVRLVWEEALFAAHAPTIEAQWAGVRDAHATPPAVAADDVLDAVLQEASEIAEQRKLARALAQTGSAPAAAARPALQAAFCIDVRSEVFRRALEAVDPGIRTIGFAGFFGLTASHRRFASDIDELRLPVLLNPGVRSCAGTGAGTDEDEDRRARFAARAKRAWGRFRLAAVSSFAFVESTGPIYAGKLVRDALGLKGWRDAREPAPRFAPALDTAARLGAAETILRAMSMTSGFARVVLLAGHGANVVNNPHASALHCGACGGYTGEVNARLLAAVLNDPQVRAGLATRGIEVPGDTLFVGALHDTTTDAVTLYDADHPSPNHAADLAAVRRWLEAAGATARAERAPRLPRAAADGIEARARDWSEVRPEWALAGCKAFIAAPRPRTAGRALDGRVFLHDYDWRLDKGFGVLELILTAPVVVGSWISLQYYGSSVAPELFGGGNKLLHNVTGGIGVAEGNGGVLRGGLPWQSVHDGEKPAHDPLRLTVCVEAPREAIADVLRRHDGVRALFDNRWLHLFALDDSGRMAWRYTGDLEWEDFAP